MVKLASVRKNRQYGPRGSRELSEVINAFVYVVATLLLLAGSILLLPGGAIRLGFTLILISMLIIVVVNLHDLYAHLAGIGFRFRYLSLDPQLLFVEIAAPLLQAIGALFYSVGLFYLLKISSFPRVEYTRPRQRLAHRILVAGPALWLLGSVHNAFQVYGKADLQVQAFQAAVTVPFILGSSFFLISSILIIESWPRPALALVQATAAWFQIAGSAFWVLAGIMNWIKVIQAQKVERQGRELEPVRGLVAEEERVLLSSREQQQAYMEERAAKRRQDTVVPVPVYKEVAVHSELNY